jgi:hypothetical protein
VWSSGQSSWLQIQKSGYDFRLDQIFWEVVGLERSPLSLVSTIEELLGKKSSDSGIKSRKYGLMDPSRLPRDTLYPQKLAVTSPTSGDHSVSIVRSRTQVTEVSFSYRAKFWVRHWYWGDQTASWRLCETKAQRKLSQIRTNHNTYKWKPLGPTQTLALTLRNVLSPPPLACSIPRIVHLRSPLRERLQPKGGQTHVHDLMRLSRAQVTAFLMSLICLIVMIVCSGSPPPLFSLSIFGVGWKW